MDNNQEEIVPLARSVIRTVYKKKNERANDSV